MDSHAQIPGLTYASHQYGQHTLQRVGVWQHDSQRQHAPPSSSSAYWIIFIHGGAWRDPRKTLHAFVPSIKRVLASPAFPSAAVRGFASINYRLSPHPEFPQDAASTPPAELRIAKHPDHARDVRSALAFLDAEYGMGDKYVLVGHSAGATMAFQLFMGDTALGPVQGPSLPFPTAVIGVAGIYDLAGLCDRHKGYDGFLSAAFGVDRASWDAISPANFAGSFKSRWANHAHLAILAASPEDTLVDMAELDAMAAKLVEDGVNLAIVKDLTGDHDAIWQDTSHVADLVAQALEQLRRK